MRGKGKGHLVVDCNIRVSCAKKIWCLAERGATTGKASFPLHQPRPTGSHFLLAAVLPVLRNRP